MKSDNAVLKTEIFIGYFVRLLVITAAFVVGIGGILYLGRYAPDAVPDYGIFKSEPQAIRRLAEIVILASTGDPHGLMQLGILFLICIPIIRVTAFAAMFAIRRDWLYCAVTGIVCAVLLFSFFGGKL